MATTFEIFQYAATTMGTMGFAALTQVFRFNVTTVPAVVLEWTAAHPGQTALLVVNGALFFTPAALTGPLLTSMGFGATGPVASSVAASLQSMLGNVGAGSVFAYLQSAAMGGYGAVVVNGATQACAVISGWVVSKL
ncbi:hypothetical protein VE02_00813 [Pseudogymnoascus sp. 03VT05]|nr:hypothetical protein VE02_00813 [Pseudogymnoascus sp. 03VT05]